MDNNNFEVECQRSGVIYVITNKLNGKQYVGQTIQKLTNRLNEHKSCKISAIGRAIKKYGWENFSVEILEDNISREKLNEREIFWITKLNCMKPNGYNLTSGGKAPTNVSVETRKKLSAARRGKQLSEETRKRISEAQKGKTIPEETRAKISARNKEKGIKPPPRTGKEPWNKGKKLSEEHKDKLSESHKGQPAYWKGKTIPEEVRKKISATLKAKNAEKRKLKNKFIEGSLF